MTRAKTTETVLTESFERHFEKSSFKYAKYVYFDYNASQKKEGNDGFNDLLNKEVRYFDMIIILFTLYNEIS